MKKRLLLPLLALTGVAFAQKPYFQQDLTYDIKVTLDDTKDELRGFETFTYKNNSPDQLTFLYMHLWPNGYRDNNTALGKQLKADGSLFFYYAGDKDRGYIDSLDFKVDGISAKLDYDYTPDIAKLELPTPLQPGQTITVTTPFHVKIPSGKISRLGHIDQQYQITQWYPKPAVYDRNGWNQIPYLNQGEFYSEFGTFDVYINLPKNYVLKATGDIVDNPTEEKFMDSIAAATKDIKAYDSKDASFPESSKEFKTVHYHQEHVHDFAWFCDKRYHVLKGDVTLPHTKKKVTTWVLFTNQFASIWKDAIPYVNDALFYYSQWNGDYTYDVCTAVDGALSAGGGMEYPNITVIGTAGSARELDLVITHEVGHNWFYGMLGSNERAHAWMDEGINSANEERYMATKYPNARLAEGIPANGLLDLDRYYQKEQYYQLYAFTARQNTDQAIETQSADFTEVNYGAIVYMKSAVIFNYCRAYLGDSLYDKCFQTYFDRWHWKHPMPEDIKAVFVEVSGKNLDWLFEDLIKTTKKLDYKLAGIPKIRDDNNQLKGQIIVKVKNTGEIKGPVSLYGMKNGLVVQKAWYDGFDGEMALTFPGGDYDEIIIDQPGWMPELNRKNNTERTSGVLKKVEPLKLQFAGSLDNPTRTQLFWLPTIGYNKYDKFMIGAALYNHIVPGKTFEWSVMPMYAFGSNSAVGHADAFFNFYPNSVFQRVRIGANANTYHYYTLKKEDYPVGLENTPKIPLRWEKVAPEMRFDFAKKRARSPINQSITLRAIWLGEEQRVLTPTGIGLDSASFSSFTETNTFKERTFYEFTYNFANMRHISPFDFNVKLQQGDDMMKAQLTANYHITFMQGKNIDIRLFGGTFLDNSNAGPYQFRMSGWGANPFTNEDYLYDHIFFGRRESAGLSSQQMVIEDGGFRIYSPVGLSENWLTAMNVVIPMPVKSKLLSHIKLYGNFGAYSTVDGSGKTINGSLYEAGVQLSLVRGICDVYFPLVYSKEIKDYYTVNGLGYNDMIRFTFALETLNPFNLLSKVQF